jgi:predicted DsbA family dithiol-disulfide isomerase
MTTIVEVFAEITCPFAYVGLKHVVEHVAELDGPVDIIVRSWPLEWVNGAGLDVAGVQIKAEVMRAQLDIHDFAGVDADSWPATTLPALALAAAAYDVDNATGLAVSLALRNAVFEEGIDICDPAELALLAASHGVEFDPADDSAVRADYEDGQARGVKGSPHYFVAEDDFFCPALELGRDAEDHLTARFDPAGLGQFLASVSL